MTIYRKYRAKLTFENVGQDVRFRKALRVALAPASVKRPDVAGLLLVPCRQLPLQHYCNLTSAWGSDRLRWHLDTVHHLLQVERWTKGEQGGAGTGARVEGAVGGNARAGRAPVHADNVGGAGLGGADNEECGMQGGAMGRRDRRGLLRRGVKGAGSGPNHAATYDRLCEKQFGKNLKSTPHYSEFL